MIFIDEIVMLMYILAYLNFAQMVEKFIDLLRVRRYQSVGVRVICVGTKDLFFNPFFLMTHDDDFMVKI